MTARRRTREVAVGGLDRPQQFAAGKARRKSVPRSAHGSWAPAKDRADPIETLRGGDSERIPSLLPVYYGRMAQSPLAFLRGSARIMAADLAPTPTIGLRVQLCGDAHVSNFGVFATPERDEVFDVDDFDETLPGPFEWDLKRLAVSIVLAGRGVRMGAKVTRKATVRALRTYRLRMAELAHQRALDIWYRHIDLRHVPDQLRGSGRRQLVREVRAGMKRTGFRAAAKWVRTVHGRYRIREEPPLIVHPRETGSTGAALSMYDQYVASLPEEVRLLAERYRPEDIAQKVVGVGSAATDCSILLLAGDRGVDDLFFLQIKQAFASALEPYAGASLYPTHGQRVVMGQRFMQESPDVFLGSVENGGQHYYVRQLRDMKFSIDVTVLTPKVLVGHAELCGAALARAHARTGWPAMISGYLGNRGVFDGAIADFAFAYAAQVERDHTALVRAVRAGRIEVDGRV